MYFASDNWAGAHPQIAAALSEHAQGFAPAYGNSDLDARVARKFCEIFEREVAVFFVGTGTAANALSLSLVNRSGGVAFAHREAHCIEDECGAPEYFTGGGRLCPVDGPVGRMDPGELKSAIARYPAEFIHAGRPMAVTITQATEIGTLYALEEIEALAEICRSNALPLHMDGARFANALVALGTTPAEMTWKRGVDIVSFGGTKNGCWCAEAVVVLDSDKAEEMHFLRKRAAQLFSKSRFVAAQFDAYFTDDLWLASARHANAMASKLAALFEEAPGIRLAWRPQANEIFPIMARATAERLKEQGAVFYPWKVPHGFEAQLGEDEMLCRFVTSFATTEEQIAEFGGLLTA
ncbi:L-threonine aldolase [Mesorhizobium sp. J18]|uniref:threonine aldolase family protein n=1 Tax=Mesorhizobium sp. J18 TaxID=935263 RepID=UPI00119C12CC|nr:low specificity L-threonine aldolase [Mesorhizobium sp. J18]TWH00167.1 L-threonine aldolase [Mesorhizobium sp. J18]